MPWSTFSLSLSLFSEDNSFNGIYIFQESEMDLPLPAQWLAGPGLTYPEYYKWILQDKISYILYT